MISIVARVIYISFPEVNKEELFFPQNPNQNVLMSAFSNSGFLLLTFPW